MTTIKQRPAAAALTGNSTVGAADHSAWPLAPGRTLILENHCLATPEALVILPAASAALNRLQTDGLKLFIVSNQSGLGRGYFTMADVEKLTEHLLSQFESQGALFEKIYVA